MNVVDLFSGIGGISQGWRSAGHAVLAGVDADPYCAATYAANFPEAVAIHGDLNDPATARRLQNLGAIDFVVGGPPCQAFSVMGKQDPQDSRAQLVERFAQTAIALSPAFVVMENVPGILSRTNVRTFLAARNMLERAGYGTTVWRLNAADYGVPQRRNRVFLVGSRAPLPSPPAPRGPVTVSDAIRDLPLEASDGSWPQAPSPYAIQLGAGQHRLSGHTFTKHRISTVDRIRNLGPGEVDASTGMRRLVEDLPAWTLRASSRTRTACRPIHPVENRVITPREAARLSGFPDSYVLSDRIAQALADIGNAVPPPLARAVAEALVPRTTVRNAQIGAGALVESRS